MTLPRMGTGIANVPTTSPTFKYTTKDVRLISEISGSYGLNFQPPLVLEDGNSNNEPPRRQDTKVSGTDRSSDRPLGLGASFNELEP